MRTEMAFMMGQLHRNDPSMVFDWRKAAQLIRERQPEYAGAGLHGDWEWTGGVIYEYGEPVPREDTYTYLASTWAVPELDLDGDIIPCYVMESETEWDSSTYWPEEALTILTAEE